MGANLLLDNRHFNPRRNPEDVIYTFLSLNMLLAPSLPEAAILPHRHRLPSNRPFFGIHSPWQFQMFEGSIFCWNPEHSVTGTLRFRFGNANLSNYTDTIGLGDLTVPQSMFMSGHGSYFTDAADLNISEHDIYEIWLGFVEPLSIDTLLSQYTMMFLPDCDRHVGITWLAVKTSNEPDDIALGIGGPRNISLMRIYERFGFALGANHLLESETAFISSLNFLHNNPVTTDIFVDTGIWANAETINFEERLAFIEENGFNYLGIVALAQGWWIRGLKLENASIINIRHICGNRSATGGCLGH